MMTATLASLSSLTHHLALAERGEQRLLVAAFAGEYRTGSLGTPDATFMTAILAGALAAWSVDGVVLDLRELSYVWGDGLLSVFRPPERGLVPLSWSVVASSRCAPALRSLFGGGDLIFDELDAAIDHAAHRAAELSKRDAVLESAWLVILVADDVPAAEVADRAAAVATRAGLAVEENGDMRCWSSGYLRTRVDIGPRRTLSARHAGAIAATPDAVAFVEEAAPDLHG